MMAVVAVAMMVDISPRSFRLYCVPGGKEGLARFCFAGKGWKFFFWFLWFCGFVCFLWQIIILYSTSTVLH